MLKRITTADDATQSFRDFEHDAPSEASLEGLIWPVHPDLNAYARDIGETPLLTHDDENELGWRIINDNCASSRLRLVRANLRLVASIARRYSGRGPSERELLEHGNAGLARAVLRFDPAQGARFSTLASWWIKDAIRKAIRQPALD